MQALVFHTVEDRGDADHVERFAPFISTNSFLGTGYYFWEENLDLAHWWGVAHCDEEYIICEGSIKCDDSVYLDLVGNVKHQRLMRELETLLSAEVMRAFNTKRIALGMLIEFCKRLGATKRLEFPFKVIRAVDHHARVEHGMVFTLAKGSFIDLDPRIIICLTEKKPVFLSGVKIIFPQKYVT